MNHMNNRALTFILGTALLFLVLYWLVACTNRTVLPVDSEVTAVTPTLTHTRELSTIDAASRQETAVLPTTPPSPSPSLTATAVPTIPTLTPTLTPTPEPQPFLPVKTGSTSGSVTDLTTSDDGRYAAVLQDTRLFLVDTLLDEVTRMGPVSAPVFSAALSPDGQTVAYWGTMESVDEIPDVEACQRPDSRICGTLFIYDIAASTTISIPFGIRVGGLGLAPDVSVANNGAVAVSGDGVIHSGTFLLGSGGEGELKQISNEAIAVSLSSDGRYLAYLTSTGAFVYDVEAGASTQVTTTWPEIPPFHETATTDVDISDDGRFVVFVSRANMADLSLTPCTHYLEQELPFCRHVYLIDRELNQAELVSVAGSGQPANDASEHAFISADGRFIVFDSFANNLAHVPVCETKFNRCPQVYLRDRQQGRTVLLTQPINGQLPNDGSFVAGISGNAAYVSIISGATNLTGATVSESFYSRKGFILDLFSYLEFTD
jgi:Tol biopolymer transport system component